MVSPRFHVKSHLKAGFTLIEMSIVLVIIGLIIGGVLVGQDLINAAAIRAQIAQIEKYNTAANTFRTKYGAIPGDISPTDAASAGLVTRNGASGRGDNNGLIEGGQAGSPAPAGEVVMFWRDLGESKLIPGNYVGTDCPWNSGCTASSATIPVSALVASATIGRSNYLSVSSENGRNYFWIHLESGIGSWGGWNGSVWPPVGMTPQESYAIDSKIDDGYPTTGQVLSRNTGAGSPSPLVAGLTGAASAGKCGNTDTTPTSYNTGVAYGASPICIISIYFQ